MGRSYRAHTGLAKSVFNFSFLRLVSPSQKKRFTMGRGCLTGDSAHYLLKNHSFYRPIVFWPCLFTDRPPLSPLAPRWKTLQRGKRLVTTSVQEERTLYEGTTVCRAYRRGKRRNVERPPRNLVRSRWLSYVGVHEA